MDALQKLYSFFGVHIDSPSALVRNVVPLLVFAGVVSIAKPFLSFARVLLSLFVLPGESVCLHSAGNSVPGASI